MNVFGIQSNPPHWLRCLFYNTCLIFCIKLKVYFTVHFSWTRNLLTSTNNLMLSLVKRITLKCLGMKVISNFFVWKARWLSDFKTKSHFAYYDYCVVQLQWIPSIFRDSLCPKAILIVESINCSTLEWSNGYNSIEFSRPAFSSSFCYSSAILPQRNHFTSLFSGFNYLHC